MKHSGRKSEADSCAQFRAKMDTWCEESKRLPEVFDGIRFAVDECFENGLSSEQCECFQKRLKAFMKEKKISNSDMADILGISREWVRRLLIEGADITKRLKKEYIIEIAYFYGISPNYLLGETDDWEQFQIKSPAKKELLFQRLKKQGIIKTDADGESDFQYKFAIVPVGNDAATKVKCAISNIVFSEYTREQKEQLLQIFCRLTKVSSDVAVQISTALGAVLQCLANTFDFTKKPGRNKFQYNELLRGHYIGHGISKDEWNLVAETEFQAIKSLEMKSEEYCNLICYIASQEPEFAYTILNALNDGIDGANIPRKYDKKRPDM